MGRRAAARALEDGRPPSPRRRFRRTTACFHGGAFFHAVGPRFDDLGRRHGIINADVLDAWYPPAPGVLRLLRAELPWLVRTSPPTGCEGFLAAVAEARGVPAPCVLPGAGSSDLIFRAFREWLHPGSVAVVPEPCYGEYAHVLERVVGCRVRRLPLRAGDGFDLDPARLVAALREGADLVVLVNPNSPTGRHVRRADLERALARAPVRTRVWIDETYVEHAGAGESLERFAARSRNVFVCKSMSKVYALSGLRAAYLVGPRDAVDALRGITPPWVVGLPAQGAAVRALEDPAYYARRVADTARLRTALANGLRRLGWTTVPGVANFLLAFLPENGPTAARLLEAARLRGLFLRDAGAMGTSLGTRAVRVAVKDAGTQRRMLAILDAVAPPPGPAAR